MGVGAGVGAGVTVGSGVGEALGVASIGDAVGPTLWLGDGVGAGLSVGSPPGSVVASGWLVGAASIDARSHERACTSEGESVATQRTISATVANESLISAASQKTRRRGTRLIGAARAHSRPTVTERVSPSAELAVSRAVIVCVPTVHNVTEKPCAPASAAVKV